MPDIDSGKIDLPEARAQLLDNPDQVFLGTA